MANLTHTFRTTRSLLGRVFIKRESLRDIIPRSENETNSKHTFLIFLNIFQKGTIIICIGSVLQIGPNVDLPRRLRRLYILLCGESSRII